MYTLPKIWQGRIQKYWDKIIPSPSTYPASNSTFSTSFDSEEETAAVSEFENQLGTEESVVPELLPEGTYASNYVGTYNVTAVDGERTLLSPERVSSENVVALHYDGESWNVVEDAEVVDGFVWGTLESFSPIAIFEYRKDIHFETSVPGIPGIPKFIVCEGNPVKVEYKEDDQKTYITNQNTGKTTELENVRSYIIGGSIDGTAIDATSITLVNIRTNAVINKIIGGSVYVPEDEESFATVGTVNVMSENSPIIGALTGSFGAVRTDKVVYNLKNVQRNLFLGCGESFARVNPPVPDLSNRAWAKEVVYSFENVNSDLAFLGQNCEYFYVDKTTASIKGGKFDYLISGGSNSRTNESTLDVKDAKIGIYQTTNRGNVASAKATFTNCEVENLFVGGDATDKTVTGTTGSLKYDINAGTYNIVVGTEDGHPLTQADIDHIVDSIKVSRSAEVTISDELKAMLGDKYIVK